MTEAVDTAFHANTSKSVQQSITACAVRVMQTQAVTAGEQRLQRMRTTITDGTNPLVRVVNTMPCVPTLPVHMCARNTLLIAWYVSASGLCDSHPQRRFGFSTGRTTPAFLNVTGNAKLVTNKANRLHQSFAGCVSGRFSRFPVGGSAVDAYNALSCVFYVLEGLLSLRAVFLRRGACIFFICVYVCFPAFLLLPSFCWCVPVERCCYSGLFLQ